jgi:hypothetical protein
MNDDVEGHMAEMFPTLIGELQRNDVQQFDLEQKKQSELRAALRAQDSNQGLTASELLKKIEGDPAESQRAMEEEFDKIAKEAKAAVAAKDKEKLAAALPVGHFPPPPTSVR